MNTLSIDIETFSSVDLKTSGVNKYVESEDFEVLLFAYKENNDEVKVIDLASGEHLPDHIYQALFDKHVLKTAFNAAFEITCLSKWLGKKLDASQWEDTMFRAAYCGYPGSLDTVSKMLGLETKKDKSGTLLIKKFSCPRKPTKRDARKRIMPADEPEEWERFKAYNKQDVVVENAIHNRLKQVIPLFEQGAWILDFGIQNKGLHVDTELVAAALELDQAEKKRISDRIKSITGIENPKSGAQMKEWLSECMGEEVKSLTKDTAPKLIKKCRESGLDNAAEALELRNELMKTSLAKYNKLAEMTCKDGTIHGILQFYGTRTGRWAGRGVQVQNLPRNSLPAIDVARELFKLRMWDELRLLYGPNLSDIASQLIRTAFIPAPGFKFAVADYSAIEARVIAWLSGETWRLDVFKTTGKIYEASASQMFNVDFEKICDKNAPEHKLRAQGKVAELALGYQGSVNALARMDYNNAIPEAERERIVNQWREKSPHIVELWNECEKAWRLIADKVVDNIFVANNKLLFRRREPNTVEIVLPSGRSLFYPETEEVINRYGHKALSYKGVNQTTKKVEAVEMYGGKIVENIVQAIARDCLSESLMRLNWENFNIKFHVHDEVIVEVKDDNDLETIINIMCYPPEWAKDLPLNAEGFVSDFYMKD